MSTMTSIARRMMMKRSSDERAAARESIGKSTQEGERRQQEREGGEVLDAAPYHPTSVSLDSIESIVTLTRAYIVQATALT